MAILDYRGCTQHMGKFYIFKKTYWKNKYHLETSQPRFLPVNQCEVIVPVPIGAARLFPVEEVEPLGPALLLRPGAHPLCNLRPRYSCGHALSWLGPSQDKNGISKEGLFFN